MKMPFLMVVLFVLFVVVALTLLQKGNLESYWKRRCTGYFWKRNYPQSSKTEIRAFLNFFTQAFGFKSSQGLCFAPSDKVMEIYQTMYPPKWTIADSLELETFAVGLEKNYGVVLEKYWKEEITLGEIFELTQSPSKCH